MHIVDFSASSENDTKLSLISVLVAKPQRSTKPSLFYEKKIARVFYPHLFNIDTKEEKVSIHIDHKEVEQVQSFTYLGKLITDDGKSEGEIRSRIGLVENVFSKRYKLLTNKNISLKTRLRLTNCYVWSLFTYACDTWTLSKQM